MDKVPYEMKNFDLDNVVIPEELNELVDTMAENVHDQWSMTRHAQGWVYGPKRDDDKKHHPCLVPFDKLTEEEKVYDVVTAEAVIKFILANGYKISK